jgi:UDP-galactopyranose mutase
MKTNYDFLIVGAGLFGSVCAYELTKLGKRCLVIDKRDHIGGNAYSVLQDGIDVQKYGPHIFRTNLKHVWNYVNNIVEFNRFTNSPMANYKGVLYNLPFNMNTFYKMWGTINPSDAIAKIAEQVKKENIGEPQNLEEKALSMVGRDIYETLIRGYTEKQWGQKATNLPPFIITRLPLRFTFDNNYFNDTYQGIPNGGYLQLFEHWLANVDVSLNTDFFEQQDKFNNIGDIIIYTGQIDRFYSYRYGRLEYRSLRFDTDLINTPNYQGCAVVNFTDAETPYTRIIEHKHFQGADSLMHTIITKEYPQKYDGLNEPYYPVNDAKNNQLYMLYKGLADTQKSVFFGGRLGNYAYLDMDKVIASALQFVEQFK